MSLKRCRAPLVVILCGFLTSLAAAAWAQGSIPGLVKRVSPSVVVIRSFDASGRLIATGTGFFVSITGDTITNYHVIADAHSAEIMTQSGEVLQVEGILAADPNHDLVRLQVASGGQRGGVLKLPPLTPDLTISRLAPAVGERVLVVGAPLGLEGTVSDGIVSGIRDVAEVGRIIQITAPISPGSSGSPVLNLKGEVVGVATFMVKGGQNLNFAIPASAILALQPGPPRVLGEASRGGSQPQPAFQTHPDCRGWVELGRRLEAGQQELVRQAYVRGLIEGRTTDVARWGGPYFAVDNRLPRRAAEIYGRGLAAMMIRPDFLTKRLDVYCTDGRNSDEISAPSLGDLASVAAFDLGGLDAEKVDAALQALRDFSVLLHTSPPKDAERFEDWKRDFIPNTERKRRAFWDTLTR